MENMEQQEMNKVRFSSVKTWAKLLPYLKKYKKNMIVISISMVIAAMIDIGNTLLSGYAVDTFVVPRQAEGIWGFAAIYLGLVTCTMLITMVMARVSFKIEMFLGRDLRRDLFVHLQELSFSYYNSTPVGTIVARVMSILFLKNL